METRTVFIRLFLVEMEKGLSPYSPISQEVAGCSTLSYGRKYCPTEKQRCSEMHVALVRIVKVLPSDDGRIRKVVVRVHRDGKTIEYTRPISELVVLIEH